MFKILFEVFKCKVLSMIMDLCNSISDHYFKLYYKNQHNIELGNYYLKKGYDWNQHTKSVIKYSNKCLDKLDRDVRIYEKKSTY